MKSTKKSKHRFFPNLLRICLYNSHYFLHGVSHAGTGPHQHHLQRLDEVAAYRVLDPSRISVHEKWFVSCQTLAKCRGLVVGPDLQASSSVQLGLQMNSEESS